MESIANSTFGQLDWEKDLFEFILLQVQTRNEDYKQLCDAQHFLPLL